MRTLLLGILAPLLCFSQQLDFLNHNRSVVDAHNCYPYEGKYPDRIERALKVGYPVAIEQDLAWFGDRVVVSHTVKTNGTEPTLRAHFFERVRPFIEKALKEDKRSDWPLIVLHFDFKDNRPEILRGVWDLLGEYESWITTAPKGADPSVLAKMDPKPLLVLTEDNDAQEQVFFSQLPTGAKLRLFGSAHTTQLSGKDARERVHIAATAPPETLLAEKPTNYRRWWNNSWYEVEEGGQPHAGDWTGEEEKRLKALVDHAHRQGFWIRFYTLDGFRPTEDQGWGTAYNFGSRESVELRWKAALNAGVDLIASDQYEDLAAFAANHRPR